MKISTVMMCAKCGKPFTPDVRTERKQKHCARYECLMERQRERQKKYRERKKADLSWRMKQARFVSESDKRRQVQEDLAAKGAVEKELRRKVETSTTKAILAGLASVVGKATKREILVAFLAKMERKGRQLLGSCLDFQG